MSPIEATTGLPALRVSSTSRRTSSEPNTLPPGESMRSTSALMLSSSRARRITSAVARPPTMLGGASSSTISPCATTMPIRSPLRGAACTR